ncbi:hypothetical protein LguiB_009199 [Lonicera macranthoides]
MDGADIGGAAIGAVFGSLLKIVKEVAITTYYFKFKLKLIEKTLISLKPKIDSMPESNLDLNGSNQETAMLVDRLKAGEKLVFKCSKIKPWDLRRKFIYSKKLKRFQKQLLRFFKVDAQIQLVCESKRTLVEVGNLSGKMDQILSILNE